MFRLDKGLDKQKNRVVNYKNSSGRQLMKTLRRVKDAVGVQYGYDSNKYE